MRVILDDERVAIEDGWTIVRSSQHFETLMEASQEEITAISFDHDLGETSDTGMGCMKWLVNTMLDHPDWFPKLDSIIIHSANSVGVKNMMAYAENAFAPEHLNRDIIICRQNWHTKMPDDFDYSQRI